MLDHAKESVNNPTEPEKENSTATLQDRIVCLERLNVSLQDRIDVLEHFVVSVREHPFDVERAVKAELLCPCDSFPVQE